MRKEFVKVFLIFFIIFSIFSFVTSYVNNFIFSKILVLNFENEKKNNKEDDVKERSDLERVRHFWIGPLKEIISLTMLILSAIIICKKEFFTSKKNENIDIEGLKKDFFSKKKEECNNNDVFLYKNREERFDLIVKIKKLFETIEKDDKDKINFFIEEKFGKLNVDNESRYNYNFLFISIKILESLVIFFNNTLKTFSSPVILSEEITLSKFFKKRVIEQNEKKIEEICYNFIESSGEVVGFFLDKNFILNEEDTAGLKSIINQNKSKLITSNGVPYFFYKEDFEKNELKIVKEDQKEELKNNKGIVKNEKINNNIDNTNNNDNVDKKNDNNVDKEENINNPSDPRKIGPGMTENEM